MGRAEREKGARRQRQARKVLEDLGYEVTNRGLPYLQIHDLDMHLAAGPPVRVEAKGRARFSIQAWLEEADLLVLVPDRAEPIIACPISTFKRIKDS